MRSTDTCRTCKAPVLWAKTAKGRQMPLDPDPVPDGNIYVVRIEQDGTPTVGVALTADAVPPMARERYVSHFVTCPDAEAWRRSRKP